MQLSRQPLKLAEVDTPSYYSGGPRTEQVLVKAPRTRMSSGPVGKGIKPSGSERTVRLRTSRNERKGS